MFLRVFCILFLSTNCVAQEPRAAWYRGEREKFEVLISGQVLLDGLPIRDDIDVHVQLKRNHALYWSQTVRTHQGRYKVWVPVGAHPWHGIFVSAQSASGAVGSNFTIAGELQKAIQRGLDLKLTAATRTISIKTTHQGQPLPHAQLRFQFDVLEQTSQTDEEGKATVQVPPNTKYIEVMAWKDPQLISSVLYRRSSSSEFKNSEYAVELLDCKPRTYVVKHADGQPIANSEVTLLARTAEDARIFAPPATRVVTDAHGRFVYNWLPDVTDLTLLCQVEADNWTDPVDKAADPIEFKLPIAPPRRTITGTVETAPGMDVAGLFVEFTALPSVDIDQVKAMVDSTGHFKVDLLQGVTYGGYVDDWQLVSEFQKVKADPEEGQLPTVKLKAMRGVPVKVQVTQGDSSEPQAEARISVRTNYSLTWAENGRQRSLGIGRYSSGVTDERGQGILYAMPGKSTVRVMVDQWNAEVQHQVAEDAPTVSFNRKLKSTVRGRVTADGLSLNSLKNIKVALASIDDRLEESQTATTDDQGKFQVESAAAALCGLAIGADEQYMGFAKLSDVHQELVVPLQRTSFVAGKLVDPDSRPLANVEIQAQVVIENRASLNPTWFTPLTRKTTTDADGNYRLERLPCQVALRIVANKTVLGSKQTEYLDQLLLSDPSDQRTGLRLVMGDERSSAKPLTLAEQWQRQLLDCRLNDYRLLVLIANKHKAIDDFLDNRLLAYNETPAIGAYMPRRLTSEQLADPSVQSLIQQYNWPAANDQQLVACIYDGQGRETGRAVVSASGEEFDKVVELVNKLAPSTKDAEENWKAALQEAAKSNRRVWVRLSGKNCGPCHLLTRWMDKHKAVLDKEFVMLKVDWGNDRQADAIAERMTKGRLVGIPFHGIYSADGSPLIDSYGPLGNIGYPGGLESLRHFRQMLETGCIHLNANEIDELVKSLE